MPLSRYVYNGSLPGFHIYISSKCTDTLPHFRYLPPKYTLMERPYYESGLNSGYSVPPWLLHQPAHLRTVQTSHGVVSMGRCMWGLYRFDI